MNVFQTTWLCLFAIHIVMFWLIGVWIAKRPLGVLIDARNKMSLSRLQLALWSVVLFSAFVAVALTHITTDIEMAPEIWALMGISVGSLAGSVIVKGTKGNQQPAQTVNQALRKKPRQGVLATNPDPTTASLADLFKSEELVDCDCVDITKVQMFFITIAAVLSYSFVLWNHTFSPTEQGIYSFPQLSASLVTLLGISHTGYLAVKAAPKTKTVT